MNLMINDVFNSIDKFFERIIRYLKKHGCSMCNIFCLLSIVGFAATIVILYTTKGEYFSELFFSDTIDTGMDFFHCIQYTRDRAPYDMYNSIYPPLANLFFYALCLLVPNSCSEKWPLGFYEKIKARGTSVDLRVNQSTMLLFILFVCFVSVCLVMLVRRVLKKHAAAELVGLCMLCSYGCLYALERGNIIILSMICSMFFALFKDSENKIISEIALIALAISAGLKIYPAIYGIILIYDKQYKKAMRAVIYGIAMFILPVFAFQEELSIILQYPGSLSSFVESRTTLFSFTNNGFGFSFDKIVCGIIYLVKILTECDINEEFLRELMPILNIAILLLIMTCGFGVKKSWEKILVCSAALVLCRKDVYYILCFMLIPLLAMINDEEKISKKNFFPFSALVGANILLPLSNPYGVVYTWMTGREQICMVCILFYILYAAISNIRNVCMSKGKIQYEQDEQDEQDEQYEQYES